MNHRHTRISMVILVAVLHTARVQMPMYPAPAPMFPAPAPPAMYMIPAPPPPPPVGIPMPYPVPVPVIVTQKPTTTTTTTKNPAKEEENMVGIPFPVPMPVPFMVPPMPPPPMCVSRPRSPGCPPCPPCACTPTCTPAFFSYCSPCHQQCRCRGTVPGPPMMMPPPPPPMPIYPLPPPVPPVVILPFPPARPFRQPYDCPRPRPGKTRRPSISSSDDSSDDSDSDDSRESSGGFWEKRSHLVHRRKPPKHRRDHIYGYRRAMASSERSDSELVKPMLTYLSKNGDVKFQRQISSSDAATLMGNKDLRIQEELAGLKPKQRRRRQRAALPEHGARRMNHDSGVVSGSKELLFRPPRDKKISNLSVSFLLT